MRRTRGLPTLAAVMALPLTTPPLLAQADRCPVPTVAVDAGASHPDLGGAGGEDPAAFTARHLATRATNAVIGRNRSGVRFFETVEGLTTPETDLRLLVESSAGSDGESRVAITLDDLKGRIASASQGAYTGDVFEDDAADAVAALVAPHTPMLERIRTLQRRNRAADRTHIYAEAELEPETAELEPGEQTTVRLRLEDCDGEPLAGRSFAIEVAGAGGVTPREVTTDEAGAADFVFRAGERPGTATITAVWETEDAVGKPLPVGATADVTVMGGWVAVGEWADPEGPPVRFRLETCDGREWTGEGVQSGVDAYGDRMELEMSFRVTIADGASEGTGPMEWRGTMTSSEGTGTLRADGTAQLSVDPEDATAVLEFVGITGTVSFRGMSGPLRQSGLGPFTEPLSPNPDCDT